MAGFTKLVPEIIQSSIWNESPEIRCVWITMLAIKDENGYVRGDSQVISRLSNITIEAVQTALEKFQQPDPHSHTAENEGRRIAPVPGGWMVLNHWLYRGKDMKEIHTEYMREWRKKDDVKKCDSQVKKCDSPSASASVLNSSLKGGPGGKIVKPTPAQIVEYAKSIGFVLDGNKFFDYYEARGWKYKGGVSMKSWKAAVRTWMTGSSMITPTARKAEPAKQSPKQRFEDALRVCVRGFVHVLESKGSKIDLDRYAEKIKDQYKDVLVIQDNGQKRFLISDAREIAGQRMAPQL